MLLVCCYVALAGTLYMTGVVWFAQLVHYPLLDRGDESEFIEFSNEYRRRTIWVVTPGLAAEIAGSVLLIWFWPSLQSATGLALLAAIWVCTCTCQIPTHLKLKHGYDRGLHVWLVRTNLVRSVLWTLRAGVMIWTAVTLP